MERLKKSYYLILMLAAGIVYLSAVDKWQIYARAMEQVKNFWTEGRGTGSGPGQQDSDEKEPGGLPDLWEEEPGEPQGSNEKETEQGNQGMQGGDLPDGMEDGKPADSGPGTDNAGTAEDGLTGEQPPENIPAEPVFVTVEDDYFSDAVFIGDSRTVGMYEYGGLEDTAAFYASTGLTVYKIFDSAIVEVPGQKKKITIEEALQENSFAKIYLMIGINEMGTGTVETFTAKYREVVEHLQELQPDAVIYIQGIIKVTTERSNQGDYINNEGIEARNQELEKLADNSSIFYLDVNPLVCDETGGLIESYTFDGVHLKAKYIQIWKDYLKENAVLKES